MIVARKKMFSNNKNKEKEGKERTEKDKSWDSVYGAGVGGAAGILGSTAIYKNTKNIRENTQNIIDEINSKYEDKADDIKRQTDKLTQEYDPVGNKFKKEIGDGKLNINNDLRKKAIRKVKLKKGLAQAGIVVAPIIGSVLGSLYGRDNDLRKQRRKMEEAAGDKVAESIKGIGKKKK